MSDQPSWEPAPENTPTEILNKYTSSFIEQLRKVELIKASLDAEAEAYRQAAEAAVATAQAAEEAISVCSMVEEISEALRLKEEAVRVAAGLPPTPAGEIAGAASQLLMPLSGVDAASEELVLAREARINAEKGQLQLKISAVMAKLKSELAAIKLSLVNESRADAENRLQIADAESKVSFAQLDILRKYEPVWVVEEKLGKSLLDQHKMANRADEMSGEAYFLTTARKELAAKIADLSRDLRPYEKAVVAASERETEVAKAYEKELSATGPEGEQTLALEAKLTAMQLTRAKAEEERDAAQAIFDQYINQLVRDTDNYVEKYQQEMLSIWEQSEKIAALITEQQAQYKRALQSASQFTNKENEVSGSLEQILSQASARIREIHRHTLTLVEQLQPALAEIGVAIKEIKGRKDLISGDNGELLHQAYLLISSSGEMAGQAAQTRYETAYRPSIPPLNIPPFKDPQINEPLVIARPVFNQAKLSVEVKKMIAQLVEENSLQPEAEPAAVTTAEVSERETERLLRGSGDDSAIKGANIPAAVRLAFLEGIARAEVAEAKIARQEELDELLATPDELIEGEALPEANGPAAAPDAEEHSAMSQAVRMAIIEEIESSEPKKLLLSDEGSLTHALRMAFIEEIDSSEPNEPAQPKSRPAQPAVSKNAPDSKKTAAGKKAASDETPAVAQVASAQAGIEAIAATKRAAAKEEAEITQAIAALAGVEALAAIKKAAVKQASPPEPIAEPPAKVSAIRPAMVAPTSRNALNAKPAVASEQLPARQQPEPGATADDAVIPDAVRQIFQENMAKVGFGPQSDSGKTAAARLKAEMVPPAQAALTSAASGNQDALEQTLVIEVDDTEAANPAVPRAIRKAFLEGTAKVESEPPVAEPEAAAEPAALREKAVTAKPAATANPKQPAAEPLAPKPAKPAEPLAAVATQEAAPEAAATVPPEIKPGSSAVAVAAEPAKKSRWSRGRKKAAPAPEPLPADKSPEAEAARVSAEIEGMRQRLAAVTFSKRKEQEALKNDQRQEQEEKRRRAEAESAHIRAEEDAAQKEAEEAAAKMMEEQRQAALEMEKLAENLAAAAAELLEQDKELAANPQTRTAAAKPATAATKKSSPRPSAPLPPEDNDDGDLEVELRRLILSDFKKR
jgi:hypothetical protein